MKTLVARRFRELVRFACVLALAGATLRAASPPKSNKVHGFVLAGKVVSVDEWKKTLVVKSAAGKDTTLTWTNATSVFGGKLAAGQSVTLKYLDRDGKHIATSIRISAPPTPTAAPTPAPTRSPTS